MNANIKYCNNWTNYSRLQTREVMVGNIGVGGSHPIRIQSMTTTSTMDTKSSVEQAISMIKAGCELVRFTAPNIKEAENLANIKDALLNKGYTTPIVADIHFTPNAAIAAAKIVEKVRINPGNFSDKKKFNLSTYSSAQYSDELKRIEEKFHPLIDTCINHNTAMRIGTNHGSLSDRIMSQYGDTPLGMVESALEFVRICEKYNFFNIILSMKASNTIVMTQAYRLLVSKMHQENMNYPLHLGVTEAGEGDDGRIKSAIGIGSLLMDGIGDTIRVSLTESPEKEMPVAKNIIEYINKNKNHPLLETTKTEINPIEYSRRKTISVLNIGQKSPPIVIADYRMKNKIDINSFRDIGYTFLNKLDKWSISQTAADYVFVGKRNIDFKLPGSLRVIYDYENWIDTKNGYPLFNSDEFLSSLYFSKKLNFLKVQKSDLSEDLMQKIKENNKVVLLIESHHQNFIGELRTIFNKLISNNIKAPVVLSSDQSDLNKDYIQIFSSIDLGSLMLDGLGDGIMIQALNSETYYINKLAFNILQATRTRISKTEYISCPSCGRTQFDLEKTTQKIRKATSHLKGLKIGVMGCIVNGPGEMADADYGYVGTGPGKISLYKQKNMIKKNIPTDKALEELILLIKSNGDWVDC
ncbi:MAG: 4-hydroxy-3-methylbut-2-en-1-yl diphosphate synthase [Flavobacteriales bacterium]|nr:4-hydroxy-3-methylbut-2-en-1-yl diphosphate synthase [Flavobacteriales bacterium]